MDMSFSTVNLFDPIPLWVALLLGTYCLVLGLLGIFGLHRYWLVHRYFKYHDKATPEPREPDSFPSVLVQLPLYNERYVAERLIRAAAAQDYPADLFEIQVLDDSTDDTTDIVGRVVAEIAARGIRIRHIRREIRKGYKAGALAHGLERSETELVAIFDADFVPSPDFLRKTVGYFEDPKVGMVQTKWDHMNENDTLLTQTQALMLDGHFVMEHAARNRSGCFFNFNGTAGIWRRRAIDEAGGWKADTLTEDLDLSYRAQLRGWEFVYCPHVRAPAELPVDIMAFKTQQRRWTQGAGQTARKLLGPIWRSDARLAQKIEASFHLLGNLTYGLLVVLALLLWPVYAVRHAYGLTWAMWIDFPMLIAGTMSLASFYANSRRELGRSPWVALALLPAVMGLGMGMSINNAWAALRGFAARSGEFVRTPKYGHGERESASSVIPYAHTKSAPLTIAELAMLAYLAATLFYCLARGLWWAVPFLVLFVFGFGYVSWTTGRELFGQSRWGRQNVAPVGAGFAGARESESN